MTSTVSVRQSLKTRLTLTTLTIVLLSLWSLSYYTSQMLHKDMERLLGEQQFSTVSYVAAEINHELNDRFEALKTVIRTISPAILGNTAAMQTFLEQRPLLARLFNGGVIAYRLDGTAIAEVPLSAKRIGVNYIDIDTVAAALKEGQAMIGRPVMGRKLLAPVFGMTVPIRDGQGNVIGALTGVTNLGQPSFLDVITESHYGKSGGYLLVAPQQRLVVTATDKSHMMEAFPAPGISPFIDRFIQGYEGSVVFVDPLGVEVLASAKGVPAAGWFMAVNLPAAEAFAPIHAMLQRMLLATVFLTLLAGVLAWWLLKRQLSPLLVAARTLSTRLDTNQPPQPLPINRQDEIGKLLGGFNRLLETVGQQNEERRIAAIAFECQEGMAVMDANSRFLRVNQAFTQITGYSQQEAQGKTAAILRSDQHPSSFYERNWSEGKDKGSWQGEARFRRKNGEFFPAQITVTAVKDEINKITHYVGNLTDTTNSQRQEQERLTNEAEHRDTLIREVHHRIKNNLQGIMGLLRQFARKHPETADLIHQAIGQVQGISVIHGLQGRAVTSSVRVCELTGAIADVIQNLWQTPVALDIPPVWRPCVIADSEAVPIALVLNELILNAVKHGGKASGRVNITLRKGPRPDVVQVKITNAGQLASDGGRTDTPYSGLHLISALMPPKGARIVQEQQGDLVITLLELAPPVISQNPKEPT